MAREEGAHLPAVLGRLMWMLIGPFALTLLVFAIVNTGDGWLTTADIAFFGVLGGMLLGRWLEFRGGKAQTASGEPATKHDLHRYLIMACLVGIGAWVAANVVANHWLAR